MDTIIDLHSSNSCCSGSTVYREKRGEMKKKGGREGKDGKDGKAREKETERKYNKYT